MGLIHSITSRQALRIRREYVKCILKQDIGWFDKHPAGQLPTTVTANMAKIQDGVGRKVGDVVFNGLSGESGGHGFLEYAWDEMQTVIPIW